LCDGPEFNPDDDEILLRLAQPWFDAIRTRAEQDGLRVHCYVGYDTYIPFPSACAELLRPDGSPYQGNWHKPQEREAMMRADWGETLRLARLASPA
jgi:hypothetical protein